jgi:hypothetical protein
MSKLNQIKIPVELEDLAELFIQDPPNYKLIRERDGLTKHSTAVMWLEFGDDGFFKEKHTEPAIGRSLIMSPFNAFFTWQTTDITDIVEERDGYIKFKTKNSVYELSRIKEENEITSK